MKPNIVLITCHDLGRFLHCYGVPTVRSPVLDAFAADGVRFTNMYCTAPQCSPSRASLFTGRYPHSNGVMGLGHAGFAWDLHPDEVHLGQVLKEAGYSTALLGIAHEGIFHTSRGYTLAEIGARAGMDYVWPGDHPAEELSAHAVGVLDQLAQQRRPFYLQIGYHEPHRVPARARPEDGYMGFIGDHIEPDDQMGTTVPPYLKDTPAAREEIAELQGAVRHVDAAIGRVLDWVAASGMEEQTLVIFTSDHGLALPRAKCSLYDPGIEIPLIVRFPSEGWTGGRQIDYLLSNLDIFPTLLELLVLPVGATVQGRSFLPLLRGGAYRPREAVFAEMTYHEYYDPMRCIRTDTHKLIVNFSAAPGFMDPSQSWRPRSEAVARGYHPTVELYDLVDDPVEVNNLADAPEYAEFRSQLLARLYEELRATHDPLLEGPVVSPMHLWAVAALEAAARA